MRIGIDATNAGSGGGIIHLKELISHLDLVVTKFPEISEIIIFSSTRFLKELPDHPLVRKSSHKLLNKGLMSRIGFQLFFFDSKIRSECDILLALTGDYIGSFQPVVGMSRNMLLYDREIWKKIAEPKEIFRFWLIFHKQKRSFKKSKGIIFISKYAREVITDSLNLAQQNYKVIHHGVSTRMIQDVLRQKKIEEYSFENPFQFIYVSTVHVYKHQWNVIRAIDYLRKKGYPVELTLVGGIIFKPSGIKLQKEIEEVDPNNAFIHYIGHKSHGEIDFFLKKSDGIIFASSCENMPNTLIESMASGLPILCSEVQPMPEFLKENGFYFDPHSVKSLVKAAEIYLNDPDTRFEKAEQAMKDAQKYSWKDTSTKTFQFLLEAAK